MLPPTVVSARKQPRLCTAIRIGLRANRYLMHVGPTTRGTSAPLPPITRPAQRTSHCATAPGSSHINQRRLFQKFDCAQDDTTSYGFKSSSRILTVSVMARGHTHTLQHKARGMSRQNGHIPGRVAGISQAGDAKTTTGALCSITTHPHGSNRGLHLVIQLAPADTRSGPSKPATGEPVRPATYHSFLEHNG